MAVADLADVTLCYEAYGRHGDPAIVLIRGLGTQLIEWPAALIEGLVREGAIKPDEAKTHPWRHVVTSSVGGDSRQMRIDIHRLQLNPGDVVLLCSDGLTEMVSREAIMETLKKEGSPERWCQELVERANEAGGKDNITVVIASYSAASEK